MAKLIKDPIQVYDFEPHKRGDTVDPKTFDITINGSAPASPITEVKIELRKDCKVYKRYSISGGEIVLNSPGNFTISQHVLDLAEGHYNYDLEVTFQNGKIKTYLRGTWWIFEDVTK